MIDPRPDLAKWLKRIRIRVDSLERSVRVLRNDEIPAIRARLDALESPSKEPTP